jgi:hypothetical protein
MKARLPNTALVKTWRRGEIPASQLEPLEQVIGYDARSKDVKILRVVSITPVGLRPVIALLLQNFRWVTLFDCTEANTARGLARIDSFPEAYMGYCVVNPKRMTLRIPEDLTEGGLAPGVILEWDSNDLLWSEGLLVGSS